MKIPLEERTKWPYQGYEEDDIVNVLENINKKAVILFSAQNGLVNTGAADQKAGLIVDYKKTPFMSYYKDTDSNSYNVAIREHEYTYTDENRIYRHMKTPGIKSPDDYYIVAMGEGFAWSADKLCEPSSNGMNAGFTFQVQLTTDSGEDIYIDILFGCSKGGEYSYVPHDNVIEFIVDRYPIGNCVVGGNVDLGLLTGNAQGSVGISSISAYENGNLFDGTYWPKGNWNYEN